MDISGNGPPKRCQFKDCKKKLKLTDYACRCNGYFCPEHRLVEKHSCSYDYKKEGKEWLAKTLGNAVIAPKVVQI